MLNENYFNCLTCCISSNEQKQTQEIRNEKIMEIREKIKLKKYNAEEHLSVALDRLLEDILG